MSDCILEAERLVYAYPCGKPALRGLTLRVPQRRKLAIVGPNGSGKTTLLLCLNGTYRPQAGAIRLNGTPTAYRRDVLLDWHRRVGLVVQDPDDQVVAPSVAQDVAFGPLNLGLTPDAARDRVTEALSMLGIECLRNAGTHELSHGQKKLVALAGVLAMRPDVILLDEPMAGLDPSGRRRVMTVLDQLHTRGTTLVMATHDMDLVYAWADDVAILQDGIMLKEGSTEAVFRDASVLETAGLGMPCVPAMVRHLHRLKILAAFHTVRTQEELFAEIERSRRVSAAATPDSLLGQERQPRVVSCPRIERTPAPKKAVLLAAFGTSVLEAEVAYREIERLCRQRFPTSEIRWAFTSNILRRKAAAAGRHLDSPAEAMTGLIRDGYTQVAVQSLHVARGQEYDGMTVEIHNVRNSNPAFRAVTVGLPLLSSAADVQRVAIALLEAFPSERQPEDAVVLMGHGSGNHPGDAVYSKMAQALQRVDGRTFLGTLEGKPTRDDVVRDLRKTKVKKAWLMPFLVAAGDHARNDLAGDDKDSWKSVLESNGIRCVPVLKGIAEYEAIAEVWLDHLTAAWRSME